MPNLRLQFSGEARKVEHKTIGGKAAVEIQLCKKNYAKQGDDVAAIRSSRRKSAAPASTSRRLARRRQSASQRQRPSLRRVRPAPLAPPMTIKARRFDPPAHHT